jgi:osmotically-inducible protein OsmY
MASVQPLLTPVAAPADYAAIDAMLLDTVRAALASAHSSALRGVDARVLRGWVTLTGEVPSAKDRHAAGQIALAVAGVRGLTNSITVRARIDHEAVSAALRTAAIRAVLDDVRGIQVSIDDGVVTLRGVVQNWRLYEAAERSVARLPSVRAVRNELVVNLRKYLPTPEDRR